MKLFVFGMGFCGSAVARHFRGLGWRVVGTSRSGVNASGDDFDLVPFEGGGDLRPQLLDGVTHLLSTIPPGPAGDPVLPVLDVLGPLPALAWAGYLSTTGVYGDHQGAWVDEDSDLLGCSPRARQRIAAEQAWLASSLPVHIFRLGGIYGPGRSALDQVIAGTAHRIVKPGQVFGRIHVDDVTATLAASVDRPEPGTVYNVCDDEPAPPQDVVLYAARLAGVKPPPEIAFDQAGDLLGPMALSFYQDNKRVSNRRIKERLHLRLRYPTYREGLHGLL